MPPRGGQLVSAITASRSIRFNPCPRVGGNASFTALISTIHGFNPCPRVGGNLAAVRGAPQ